MPHNVIRILGASPDGEVWSVNPRYVVKGVLGGTAAVEDAEAMETICAGIAALNDGYVLPTVMRQALSSSLSITGIRMEAISDEGLLIGAAEHTLATPVAGTTAPIRPLNVAWCVTLNHGAQYGRSGRGRLFWPALGSVPALGSTLRVTNANRAAFLGDLVGWLEAVAGIIRDQSGMGATSARQVVWSRTKGTITEVDNLSLGDILDSQRRRRDALREQRTTIPWP